MFGIGWQELLIGLVVLLLLFGAKKLPELARSMGTAVNEFKDGLKTKPEDKTDEEQSEAHKEETEKQH